MNTLKEVNRIQELFNRNRLLLNTLIGYYRHDINQSNENVNILSALETISEQQDELEKLIESLCK